jgi:predicted enzyme related to lactoylglutathione lyase
MSVNGLRFADNRYEGSVMKLAFVYLPVEELSEAVAFYRDTLELREAWREGDHTAAFAVDSSDVQLMVGVPAKNDESAVGPLFIIDDVNDFVARERDSLRLRFEPREIPPGRLAGFDDPAGNLLRVMDVSKEAT